jgi:hypothetical protein
VGLTMRRLAGPCLALVLVAPLAASPTAEERFREAGELARGGDSLRSIGLYRELAASGNESASLYWNWAQVASARGAAGEALWALLRARELSPGETSIRREIERLRGMANLDAAEIAPETLDGLARASRRFRLDLLALVLLALSVPAHAAVRLRLGSGWPGRLAWGALALGLCVAAVPLLGSLAHPPGVVVRRGAPLLDAASPSAATMGSLREGEVVPFLERSKEYVRVEDSSGARGWARAEDVWALDAPPRP